jgi:hypothetical protein
MKTERGDPFGRCIYFFFLAVIRCDFTGALGFFVERPIDAKTCSTDRITLAYSVFDIPSTRATSRDEGYPAGTGNGFGSAMVHRNDADDEESSRSRVFGRTIPGKSREGTNQASRPG